MEALCITSFLIIPREYFYPKKDGYFVKSDVNIECIVRSVLDYGYFVWCFSFFSDTYESLEEWVIHPVKKHK